VVRAGLPTEYFIESFGSGLSGCVTVESRKIEKLQGMPLYTLATLRALNSTTPMPMEIVSDGQLIKQPTLLFSVMNGKREGSFMLAPNAQMNDGWFDYVHARDVGWYQALGLLPRIALFGTPSNHPRIGIGRCRSIQIRTDWNLTIHIDGEILARPEDGVREVGIEILPARLQVELLDV
jgi:diacylglycerol kinase (ATP)